MVRRRFLLLPIAIAFSGCASAVQDAYNQVTVATGCHLLRAPETEECRRLAQQNLAQQEPTAKPTPR